MKPRRNLWLSGYGSNYRDDARSIAEFTCKLLPYRVCGCYFVEQEKTGSDNEIGRSQSRRGGCNDNADRENYGSRKECRRLQRYDLRNDNSRHSHERETGKWLTRRTEQFHLLAVFAYRALAAQVGMHSSTARWSAAMEDA